MTAPSLDVSAAALAADRLRLLAMLTERSYAKKKIVLSSGRESDFYIDCKQTVLTAEGHWLVGKLMFATVREKFGSSSSFSATIQNQRPCVASRSSRSRFISPSA